MKPACKIALLAAALVFTPLVARAEGLSEDQIRKYYADSVSSMKKPYVEYRSFLEKGFSDDYVSTQTLTLKAQGMEPMTKTSEQKKTDLMNFNEETHKIVQQAKVTNDIKKIDIAADGKTAKISAHNVITAELKSSEGTPLFMTTAADCDDDVTLKTGQVQMTKSTCTAETSIVSEKK